eukprot:COSAG02_NODE_59217_length_275_cov_0.573864_1_plen_36_part_01
MLHHPRQVHFAASAGQAEVLHMLLVRRPLRPSGGRF